MSDKPSVDYKATLNLPATGFPMKANLAQREPNLLSHWQQIDIYQQMRTQGQAREQYILHDGPPYANGRIHLGHAVNKVLKDIINKNKTLSGYDTPYVPGWDCHGLPIELNVEKKHGKAGEKISAKAFRQACRDYAEKQVALQREDFVRLGIFADWQQPYLTMSPQYEADIMRTLARLIDKGHLHRGYKPVHWCIDCRSALAEAEVEYQEKNSPAIDVCFPVLDEEALWQRCHHVPDQHLNANIDVIIWTTTPWTLPANQAVAVNPKSQYVIAECTVGDHKRYLLLADSLLKEAMVRYGIDEYRVKAYCEGAALEGLLLQHPFYDRQVPLLCGNHVTLESGTGCVHTAPGHGLDDYLLGMQHQLPVDHEVEANGCFSKKTEFFAGMHVFKANEAVMELLKTKGHLLHAERTQHSYPHCWRHKTPLIFRGTPQWFISMEQQQLRQSCLNALDAIQFVPETGEARMRDMLEKRPDWCISRQRSWGVPLPLILHKETQQLHPDNQGLIEKIAEQVEQHGMEAWHELDLTELLGEQAREYEKANDTLDVWFDSGASFANVLERRPDLRYPADVYLEGSDQHRGWFQTALLTAIGTTGEAPYRTLITHGFTVDDKGHKMSKSLGNVIAPEKIIKTLGADILRFWIASADYRSEMALSDEILKRMTDHYRRIRNTARFLLANLAGFDPAKDCVDEAQLLALDKWALDKTRLVQQDVVAAYDAFQFHVAMQKIHHFCAIEMGSFYLDVIKDRQYTTQADSLARRSTQTAMYRIIEAMVHWLAPVLSFTAEEIWQHLPGERQDSVFLSTWSQQLLQLAATDPMGQPFWEKIIAVRNAVNKALEGARAEGVIGSALNASVTLYAELDWFELLFKLEDELHFVLITSEAVMQPAAERPASALATDLPGLWVQIQACTAPKCVRCWHHHPEVGHQAQHPELCPRCVTNVIGKGEVRRYA